jgi:quinol-cytochrome oxidoreductase complex cytochrome b subunit
MELRRRAVAAAAVLLLGVAFCFAMYWWQLRYEYAAHGVGLPLFTSLPFVGLAVMVFAGMGRVAAVLEWLVLAALTGIAYISAATSSSSTAVVVFIAPFVYGAIVLSILFAVDRVVRSRKERRAREKLA